MAVLLTNAQLRKTLAATRSLGSKGIKTIVSEKTRVSPASFSKYCDKSLVYPDPKQKKAAFYEWLKQMIQQEHCEVLFPMDDDVMEIVIENKAELARFCHLPVPPKESYLIAADKGKTIQLAKEAGVFVPATYFPKSMKDVLGLAKNMAFPVVIKPRKSSGSRGIKVARDAKALVDYYTDIHVLYPYPLIQEWIPPGVRYDVCLLFNQKSEVKASFVQKEIRHFPLERGPSTAQESVYDPELVAQSVALMEKLPWYGVVELEFMVDPRSGRPLLMEINPRFWNSLEMAVVAGVDFPYLLYQLAMCGEIEGVFHYEEGKQCRSLLPADALHFLFNNDRFRMNPSFFRGERRGVHDDIVSRHDPFPVIGFFLAALRYAFVPEMWKMMFKR